MLEHTSNRVLSKASLAIQTIITDVQLSPVNQGEKYDKAGKHELCSRSAKDSSESYGAAWQTVFHAATVPNR